MSQENRAHVVPGERRLDVFDRKVDRPERAYDASLANLVLPVVAVTGVRIDVRRFEDADLAVVAQGRDGQAGEHRERADAEELSVAHARSIESQPG